MIISKIICCIFSLAIFFIYIMGLHILSRAYYETKENHTYCKVFESELEDCNWILYLTTYVSDAQYQNWVKVEYEKYKNNTNVIECFYIKGKTDSLRLKKKNNSLTETYIILTNLIIVLGVIILPVIGLITCIYVVCNCFSFPQDENIKILLIKSNKNDICPVCFETTNCMVSKCKHYLCKNCANKLIKKICPICRSKV